MRLSIQRKIGYFEFNKKYLNQARVSHKVNPEEMKTIHLKLFLILHLFCNHWVYGQTFEKKIEPDFNGSIIYGSEIKDSYLFLGYQTENNELKLYCYKTDKSGNVILKNNSNLLLNTYFNYAIDTDQTILITNADRLIKLNSNLETQWVKTISGLSNITSIKLSNTGNYILSSSTKIVQTDTSGLQMGGVINFNYTFCDVEMYNDTMYLMQYNQPGNVSSIKIILQKYTKTGSLLVEKTIEQFAGYRPKILVLNIAERKINVFADIPSYGRTTLAAIDFDVDFNVITSTSKTFQSLWVTLYRYQNNSFLIGGDYDGKANGNDVIFALMDDTLDIKLNYGSNGSYYKDLYATHDGYILATYGYAHISKIAGPTITSVANTQQSKTLNCYPNPFTESTSIKFKYAQNIKLEIYDAQGNMIHAKESVNAEHVNIKGSVLATTGLYFYRIHADGELYSGKLVKE